MVATGETHSVREFCQKAGEVAGFDFEWEGEAENEVARDKQSGEIVIRVDPDFYRPAEVNLLIGDATKAKEKLGWAPKVKFSELVELMMRADLQSQGLS